MTTPPEPTESPESSASPDLREAPEAPETSETPETSQTPETSGAPGDLAPLDVAETVPLQARSPYWRPPSSSTGAGRFVTVCLAAFIGVLAVQVATSASLLVNYEEWTESDTQPVAFLMGWLAGIAFVVAGIAILTGIAWMVWQHRAHANRSTMVPNAFKPGSVWWWLVPVASLFMPFLAIRDLMKSGVDRPFLRRGWWVTYLLFGLATGASTALSINDLGGISREVVALVSYLLGIASAVMAIAVVRSVNRAIEARREEQNWPPGWKQITGRTQLVLALGAAAATSAGALFMGIALPELLEAAAEAEGETLATETFVVGTCFNDNEDQFPQVSCDLPHEAEAFAVLDHPDQPSYPGQDALGSWAEPLCYGRFERYTGVRYEDSPLDFGYLFPTSKGWAAGDREVICYLFDPSGDSLNEPIKTGSGSA